ncbi:hypothetical protein [Roseateles noduli]|uniref:hypothetical protein n=1 Tax=Roseateles noduli TaxID=2052484 RepID=UPI003D65EFF9
MRKIASATLSRVHPRERRCTVELVELDVPAGRDGGARYVVTVRQESGESSLTATPCPLADAERRALDFIRRRLAAGETLVRRQGFDALAEHDAAGGSSANANGAVGTTRSASSGSSTSSTTSASAGPVPPRIAALVARFEPARWKLESADRQTRSAWRVAECSDRTEADPAAQRALRGLVPRLVDLLGSGSDLLDLCLAAAIGRLGDPGAAEAMRILAERGRSPATKRFAHQARLMLLSPEDLAAHAELLASQWSAELALELDGPELVVALLEPLDAHRLDWPELMQDWYDIALARPAVRERVLSLLRALPVQVEAFQAMRYVYKAAELRRDAQVVAVLHARFENTRQRHGAQTLRNYVNPMTGETIVRVNGSKRKPARAYGRLSREYLRLRGLRNVRRLATIGHPHAPGLAVELLLGLRDDEIPAAAVEHRSEYVDRRWATVMRHYPAGANWLLVTRLLLAQAPNRGDRDDGRNNIHAAGGGNRGRAKRVWTREPIDVTRALPERAEGLREMWDAHPEALLRLAMESRSALVHAVVARALQDHADFLGRQTPAVLERLLRSPYAPTAETGFAVARAHVDRGTPAEQIQWLKLMASSAHPPARDFALLHIAGDPGAFAGFPDLIVALLLSGQERARKQGHGLALLATPQALLDELRPALLAADAADPGLAEGVALIEQLLTGPLAAPAGEAVLRQLGALLPLLHHPAVPVVQVGVTWLLLHPTGVTLLPPALMKHLIGADDPDRRACGVRLLAALPDEVLRGQVELIGDLATHAHAGIRSAVGPALLRVARGDAEFTRLIADRLHRSLFQTESGDGAHTDALRWLTQDLAPAAPARDASGAWRALQARSAGAQRYGAWALMSLTPADFSLRQLATLARHPDTSVRHWSMRALDLSLPAPPSVPTPDQAEQLLPLAEADFDDAVDYTRTLFGERLPDESLAVELLIAWVDHPKAWVQALGRARLVRRMSAADASLCLTRLSQHPGTQVQLFVTQWLLELPTDDKPQLAQRLRALTPYFLTVLSQVHRGRAAKSRITAFLRAQTDDAGTAAVVAEIFARQVVTASLTDKPQYIAGLRDIAARHPGIALPFLNWKQPAVPAASASSGSSTSSTSSASPA